MRFLVSAAMLAGAADPASYVQAETARIDELIAAGVTEHCYVTADHSGAYLVVNTHDRTEAESVMQTLPMAQAGLLKFTFVELAPDET
jgi:putative NIF3 family GTP cyclohydrolase 1 type 2